MDRESDVGSSETGSGRETPSVEQESYRSDTPGPLPVHQYTKDKLYDIEKEPASKLRPVCLAVEFIVDGVWDPERWFRSFGGTGSRGPSPPVGGGEVKGERKIEKEIPRRLSGSTSLDPKERLKGEKDGIVLSPQRRSFGTGCHVTHNPVVTRQMSNTGGDYTKDNDRDRDRDRRDQRRIGSGRIQIDRERGDFRTMRDRYDRDDRDRDRRFERDKIFVSRRDVDERNPRDFRDFGRQNSRRDRHDSHKEEEPEWFSAGPVSKNETIELHGFDKPDKKPEQEKRREAAVKTPAQEEVSVEEEEKEGEEEEKETRNEGISVADRNGSLETNESSSPEANQSDVGRRPSPAQPTSALFDFNEFFKIENIPGLSDEAQPEPEQIGGIGGSRFYQLFKMSAAGNHSNSQENSRRSSLTDEFGYLNDLLNGSKSPVVPSPPPPSASSVIDRASFLSPFAANDKQMQLEFGTVGQKGTNINPLVTALINNATAAGLDKDTGNISTQETEAKLKALLFGKVENTPPSSGTASPGYSSPLNVPGKVKTLAELEAGLRPAEASHSQHGSKPGPRLSTPPGHSQTPPAVRRSTDDGGDLTAFNKLISLMKAGAATPVESPKIPIKVEPRPSTPDQMVANHQHGSHPGLNQQSAQMSEVNLQPAHFLQNSRGMGMDAGENFMMPPGPPPLRQTGDNLSEGSLAQSQFLQALQRNKEQQLQIRQAAINNMRLQGSGSTPPQQAQGSQGLPPQQMPQQSSGGPAQMNQPRRLSQGDPIVNFLKQNPTIITKPASPTPPPPAPVVNLMQHVSGPRAQSPVPGIPPALLTQQPPQSPRVPSPIMFSQQPPMHLSAPSPIHPSQVGPLTQSPTGQQSSTTTASIRPPSVPRVPSPQELIAHTQAILQNALIKKQLEDQKERFYKKQQERGKSPNPLATPTKILADSPSTSTPVTMKPPVSFTPTSVIRKMYSEKASEKEKLKSESMDKSDSDAAEKSAPVKQTHHQTSELGSQEEDPRSMHPSAMNQGGMAGPGPDQMMPPLPPGGAILHNVPPPPLPNQVLPPNLISTGNPMLPGMAFTANQMARLPPPLPHAAHLPPMPSVVPTAVAISCPNPGVAQVVTSDQGDAGKMRALVGQGTLQTGGPVPGQSLPTSLATPGGRPIIKGVGSKPGAPPINNLQQQMMAPPPSSSVDQNQFQQRPILGGSTSTPVSAGPVDVAKLLQQQKQFNSSPGIVHRSPTTPYGVPISGRIPIPPAPVMTPPASGPGSAVLMQQMVQGGNPRVLGQFSHLAALQTQQRMIDPRVQGSVPGIIPGAVPQMLSPRNTVAATMPNPAFGAAFGPRVSLTPQLAAQKNALNGPTSPGFPVSSLNGNNNLLKQDANLMKWFGTDMLKTQLPNLPPLPAQGQRVMTVDEIERS